MTPRPRDARTCLHLLAVLMLAMAFAGVAGCGDGAPAVSLPAPVGSALPNLAMTADGMPVLSWVEPTAGGHRLNFAVLEDAGWSEPRTVAGGPDWFVNWADVPSVVPLHDDLWAAHWLVESQGGMYAYDIAISASSDGGLTWRPAFRPHTDDTPTEHGFVSLFPTRSATGSAAIGAVWLDGREMLLDPAASTAREPRMTLRSGVFDPAGRALSDAVVDPQVCECCRTSATVSGDAVVIGYRDRSDAEQRDIATARLRGGAWQPTGLVADDGWTITGCPVNGPALSSSGDAVAVAWFSDADGTREVRAAWRESGTANWSAPFAVADATLGRVDVAWLEDGALAVSWMSESGPGQADVLVARVERDGVVHAPVRVATTAAARPAGFPRLLRHGNALLIAWTRWQDDQSRVVISTLPTRALTSGA